MHAESPADINKDPPDLPGANDAHGFAVEIKAGQPAEEKLNSRVRLYAL